MCGARDRRDRRTRREARNDERHLRARSVRDFVAIRQTRARARERHAIVERGREERDVPGRAMPRRARRAHPPSESARPRAETSRRILDHQELAPRETDASHGCGPGATHRRDHDTTRSRRDPARERSRRGTRAQDRRWMRIALEPRNFALADAQSRSRARCKKTRGRNSRSPHPAGAAEEEGLRRYEPYGASYVTSLRASRPRAVYSLLVSSFGRASAMEREEPANLSARAQAMRSARNFIAFG